MKRRAASVVAIAAAIALSAGLSSCATFDRNDVAARVGTIELTDTDAQALVAGVDPASAGPTIRVKLTSWIKLASVASSKGVSIADFEQQSRTQYEQGLAGSPLVCLAAIRVDDMTKTGEVLTALQSGTSFADAVSKYSTDTSTAAGGVVVGPDGNECIPKGNFSPEVTDAMKDAPVGQPVAHDFGTFAAILLLRPYDDLPADARSDVAIANFTELQLASALKSSGVYVDPRYGRWSAISESVEPLSS